MNADEPASAPNSDATSPIEPGREPSLPLTEAALLDQEAREAQAAIVRTLRALEHDLTSADVRGWTREHPWAAVGIASLAGFAAAAGLTTAARQPGERESQGPLLGQGVGQSCPAASASRESVRGARLDWLMEPLFDLLRVSVERFVASWAASRGAAVADEPGSQPTGGEASATERSTG